MSRMPGSFARQGDEPEMELELSVTESEYDPSGAGELVVIACTALRLCELVLTHAPRHWIPAPTPESEMSIGEGDEDEDDAGNGLFMEEDDDDEDDDDDDVDYEDGEGQFADFELDIDEDEYGDPELAEAERLASAASALGEDDDEDDGEDDVDDGNATETETRAAAADDGPSDGSYSVAVDCESPPARASMTASDLKLLLLSQRSLVRSTSSTRTVSGLTSSARPRRKARTPRAMRPSACRAPPSSPLYAASSEPGPGERQALRVLPPQMMMMMMMMMMTMEGASRMASEAGEGQRKACFRWSPSLSRKGRN